MSRFHLVVRSFPLALAAVLGPPVVAGAAAHRRRPRPGHKHYDDAGGSEAPAAPGTPLAPRLQNLGVHTFPVSTKVARAQLFMNQGLNLTYGFNHAEAARAFAEAARLDPTSPWRTGARRSCSDRTSTRRWTPEAEPKACALDAEGGGAEGDGHAARARLHRRAGGALHRQAPRIAPRPTAPMPTRCAR